MAAAAVLPPSAWAPHTQPPLHKRKYSASSPAVAFQEPFAEREPDANSSTGHSIRIKPYLRKLSLRDTSNLLDLSRPSAENEGLAGLGFYDESRSTSDLAFPPTSASRARHQRSTSNTSNFSNSSTSHQRPGAPYVQPFRHTPRPYTPPIARSITASSLLGSEDSEEAEDIMSGDDFRSRQRALDHTRRSGSIGSLPAVPQNLHMHSSSSLTRLNMYNPSQSSLPCLPASRPRGDTMRSIDTMQTSSRTSMDKAMTFIRAGPGKEELDPTVRAAHIAAARQAYAEREEAKERKAEKELLKYQDKVNRKRQQKDERTRRKSESSSSRPRIHSEKSELVGKAYADYSPAHSRTLPHHVPTTSTTAGVRPERSAASTRSTSMKSRWLAFMAWFRTRLLRIGRKMGGGR